MGGPGGPKLDPIRLPRSSECATVRDDRQRLAALTVRKTLGPKKASNKLPRRRQPGIEKTWLKLQPMYTTCHTRPLRDEIDIRRAHNAPAWSHLRPVT
eukprot:756523-Hanusia_phi.AAC.1